MSLALAAWAPGRRIRPVGRINGRGPARHRGWVALSPAAGMDQRGVSRDPGRGLERIGGIPLVSGGCVGCMAMRAGRGARDRWSRPTRCVPAGEPAAIWPVPAGPVPAPRERTVAAQVATVRRPCQGRVQVRRLSPSRVTGSCSRRRALEGVRGGVPPPCSRFASNWCWLIQARAMIMLARARAADPR